MRKLVNQFFHQDWSSETYALGNRLTNWIGYILSPKWDHRLLGLKQYPISSILDIGANEGQFCRQIRRVFPDSTIYAFEPLVRPLMHLERWAQKENCKKPNQIFLFPIALGEESELVAMQQHVFFTASSSVLKTTQRCNDLYPFTKKQNLCEVQQLPLDKVIQDLRQFPEKELLIKLDVQGYEDRVIRGGWQTFQQAIACIVEISLQSLYLGQAHFSDIFKLLSQLGFVYAGNLDQVCDRQGKVIFLNALFVKQSL